MPLPDEPTVSTERPWTGRLLKIRVDTVRLHDGKSATREIVEHPGAVVIAPIDDQGRVLLVRQYRKAAEQELLELPAGGLKPGEEPAAAAMREMQEECGCSADTLQSLGGFYSAPGFCEEFLHLFLATGLHDDPLAADEDENVEVELVALDDALQMIDDGTIRDAKTVAGLLRVARLLR